jgi:hypothetical protein
LRTIAAFLFACVVVVLRRPDAVFHAQFYAEDGAIWYATAYNYGWWRVLCSPFQGYIHLIPRLTAGLALLFPMLYAPLVENLVAIAIQALPVNLLLSRRSMDWGSRRFRSAMALLYLIMPNTQEVFGIREAQWYLALSAFLLIVARPPDSVAGRTFSLTLLILCCLTGPFALSLFPVAIVFWLRQRDAWKMNVALVMTVGAVVQASSLLMHTLGRHHPVLGASVIEFTRILGGQVYIATLLGHNDVAPRLPVFWMFTIASLGTVLFALCAASSNIRMRAFIVLAALLFFAALASPIAFPAHNQTTWQVLALAKGIRYWFFPCLGFLWALAYGFQSPHRSLRIASGCLCALMLVGIIRDFRYAPLPDMNFAAYVEAFEKAQPHTLVEIPTNPNAPWKMQLVKR